MKYIFSPSLAFFSVDLVNLKLKKRAASDLPSPLPATRSSCLDVSTLLNVRSRSCKVIGLWEHSRGTPEMKSSPLSRDNTIQHDRGVVSQCKCMHQKKYGRAHHTKLIWIELLAKYSNFKYM